MLALITAVMAFVATTHASNYAAQNEAIWDTHRKIWVTLADIGAAAEAGEVFVLGEEHATTHNASLPSTFIHHDNQVRLLNQLQAAAVPRQISVSVGMEFLTYTAQTFVDQFVAGTLSEADFIKNAGWSSGSPIEFYRGLILGTRASGGHTVALNIPQEVAAAVSKSGPNSLTASQRTLLPPTWERGNDAYFARFSEAMKDHAKPAQIENYFWAQSLWDDTMAWKALEHLRIVPKDILLIVVGEFHTQFGGGLPYELKKLGAVTVKTVVQIEADDWTPATLQSLIQPDATYGDEADYLWLHQGVAPGASDNGVPPQQRFLPSIFTDI